MMMKIQIRYNPFDSDMVEMYSEDHKYLLGSFHEDSLTGSPILSVLRELGVNDSEFVDCQMLEEGETDNAPTIELGHGEKLVTDTHNHEEGWAGICISDGACPVGETIDTGAVIDSDLDYHVRIITKNPKSLDVIIEACERAKTHLAI